MERRKLEQLPVFARYLIAAGFVAAAILISQLILPFIIPNPFILFFAAVAISAWIGGLGPGLAATLLSVLAASYFFIAPYNAFSYDAGALLRLGVFVFVALLISGLSEARLRAAEAAYEQGERYRVTLGSIGDAVIATDAQGRITFMNPVAATLTGWTPAEAQTRSITEIFQIVHAQTRQPVENPVDRVLREGITVGLANHTVLIARDGTERPIDDSGAPIRDASGTILGVILVFRDVTEREQAETAQVAMLARVDAARADAEANRAQLAVMLESMTDGFLAFDREWRFTYVNAEAASMLGRPPAELIGKNVWDEFPESRETSIGQLYIRAMAEGVPLALEDYYPPFDAWLSVRVYPSLAGLSGFFLNVTERVRAEKEREELLAREQAARHAAEEAVQVRDQFISIAAHELRTPLTTLLGNTQLVQRRFNQDGGLDERNRRSLTLIERQARRLNRMVMAMLDISRISSGQLSIERAPVDMTVLTQRVVDDISASDERRLIELAIPDQPLVVPGDEVRLEQVLQNLIQNALRYSPESEPVTVTLSRREEQVHVAVQDRGIGIPASARPYLFQRFFRAQNAQANVSGMGIGLYVVKEIVTLHGGTITVESTEGMGSTFMVSLPLA